MSDRTAYDHGVPSWVSSINADPAAAAAFYAHLFGWEPGEDLGGYFLPRLRGRIVAGIGSLPPGVEQGAWMTHVQVDDAGDVAERARAAGGTVLAEPFDGPTARMAVLADPAGASFCVSEAGTHAGCEVVNEPGAWSMSSLATPDVEAAKRFYGAVFGWTTETFEMGDASIHMFRLPGYVGGEPQQPVSREVVATMMPAPEGAPPAWTLDFWTDDVDAAVDRTRSGGGSVVAGPFDIPIGRTAVVADPKGVAFSVSSVTARAESPQPG